MFLYMDTFVTYIYVKWFFFHSPRLLNNVLYINNAVVYELLREKETTNTHTDTNGCVLFAIKTYHKIGSCATMMIRTVNCYVYNTLPL